MDPGRFGSGLFRRRSQARSCLALRRSKAKYWKLLWKSRKLWQRCLALTTHDLETSLGVSEARGWKLYEALPENERLKVKTLFGLAP